MKGKPPSPIHQSDTPIIILSQIPELTITKTLDRNTATCLTKTVKHKALQQALGSRRTLKSFFI